MDGGGGKKGRETKQEEEEADIPWDEEAGGPAWWSTLHTNLPPRNRRTSRKVKMPGSLGGGLHSPIIKPSYW